MRNKGQRPATPIAIAPNLGVKPLRSRIKRKTRKRRTGGVK